MITQAALKKKPEDPTYDIQNLHSVFSLFPIDNRLSKILSQDLRNIFCDLIDRQRIDSLNVTSERFVFDPQSGQTFNINKSGAVAIEVMRETRNLEQSIAKLSHLFDTPYEIVCGSFEVFLRQLSRHLS
jgi:hypothetical protein